MKFGAKEVMVIAALAFGIVAAGCSSSFKANLAMDPQLRTMNTGGFESRIYFSRFECDFYYPSGKPSPQDILPEKELGNLPVKGLVVGGPCEGDEHAKRPWSPTLPAFFK